jgi:hypothetical protein
MNARNKSGRDKPKKSAGKNATDRNSTDQRPKTVMPEAADTLERVSEAAPEPAMLREHEAAPIEKAFARAERAAEGALPTFEKSLQAAGQSAIAVNQKLIDIAQEHLNSGLELARDLAGARNPLEVMRLHMSYWHDLIGAFESQARELRELSAELVARANEPLRAHMRRSWREGASP